MSTLLEGRSLLDSTLVLVTFGNRKKSPEVSWLSKAQRWRTQFQGKSNSSLPVPSPSGGVPPQVHAAGPSLSAHRRSSVKDEFGSGL